MRDAEEAQKDIWGVWGLVVVHILIILMVLQVWICLTYHVDQFKHMSLVLFQLHLNKIIETKGL